MKLRGVKKLLYGLVPATIAAFSLSIVAANNDSAVVTADEAKVYAFDSSINAFQNGREFTIPANESGWETIIFKSDVASGENPYYPALAREGYLAYHLETDTTINMWPSVVDAGAEVFYGFNVNAYLVDDNGNSVAVGQGGQGIYIPAGFRGAVVVPTSDFGGADLSTIQMITANFHSVFAGANVKLGSLGYYAYNGAELNVLTTADGQDWKTSSKYGTVLPVIGEKAETTEVYTMRTGTNAFAYGKQWNVANYVNTEAAEYATIWYKTDTGAVYDLDANGYFALQMETYAKTGFYTQVFDGANVVANAGYAYFVTEEGDIEICAYNVATQHIEIPAGLRGMLIIPATNFVSDVFNWDSVSMYIPNINADAYPTSSFALGELGWFDGVNDEMYYFTSLRDMYDAGWKVTDNALAGMTSERIEYIPEMPTEYEMRTGDNAFAYGVSWSGVEYTAEATYAKMLVTLDSASALDMANGILAVQMEYVGNGSFKFAPSVWDGASEIYFTGTATLITEDGLSNNYVVGADGCLDLPASKGVVLLPLKDFVGAENMAVSTFVFTVNTALSHDYKLNVGEIGYYASATAEMTKILTLDSVKDYNQFLIFNTSGYNQGSMARIANTEIAPTVRYVSVSAAGDVGLIFYVECPNQASDVVTATYTVEGYEAQEVTGVYSAAKGCFAFIASVSPKDYKKNVTLKIGDNTVYTTTVNEYATSLLHATGFSQETKDLALALIKYCEAARAYFEHDVVETKVEFSADLSAFAANKVDNEGKVTIENATLTLGAKTMINIYFRTDDINAINVSGAVVKHYEGNVYVATIENVVAKYLDNTYTVQIGEDVVNYSALSYVYQTVADNSTPANLYNLVVALYNYNVAANAYFGA